MTKKEILDAIHGKMIISCQAVEGEPLYVEEKSIMYLMARAPVPLPQMPEKA